MREPRYSILSDINDGIDRAKQGKLALYWQRNIEHEYRCKKVTPAEQQAYTDLQDILAGGDRWPRLVLLLLGRTRFDGAAY